ncbi:MAG: hypothetical protein ACLQPD_09275 [Desulfomonilaceae bacterium]
MPSPPVQNAGKNKKKAVADLAEKVKGQPLWIKVALPIGILGVIALVAYGLGVFTPVFRLAGLLGPNKDISLVQSLPQLGDIDRPDMSVKTEESMPVDPSKARLPLLDKPVLLEGKVAPEQSPSTSESSPHARERASPQAVGTTPAASTSGEPPSIVTRQPTAPPASRDDASTGAPKEPDSRDSTDKEKQKTIAAATPEGLDSTEKKPKEPEAAVPPRKVPSAIAARKPSAEPENQELAEQFQYPGSLIVNIPKYSGVIPKWGLMVILDDSAIMGRKGKNWNPSRFQTAMNLIGKLPTAIAPGSKIAVRDFVCTKSEGKKKASVKCLSNIRYDWAESPFKGLTEKVGQSSPGGINNPCAAAVFSLKKDFASIGGMTPRILVLTDGTPKCNHSDLFNALDEHGKDKVSVDVIALGINKKRLNAYSSVTKKTNGFFFKVDKPSDIETAVKRYDKVLKTKLMEKIEIRGDKASLTTTPGQEITLVPGSYSVVLPVVAGIQPSKRRIERVKISSGQTTEIEVKRGRPIVKIGKKQKNGLPESP